MVYTKKRNRLAHEKLNDFVCVYYNLDLYNRYDLLNYLFIFFILTLFFPK